MDEDNDSDDDFNVERMPSTVSFTRASAVKNSTIAAADDHAASSDIRHGQDMNQHFGRLFSPTRRPMTGPRYQEMKLDAI